MTRQEKVRLLTLRAIGDIAVFSFVINLLLLVMPLYMLQVYDRVLASASLDTLVFLSMIAGVAILVMAILEIVRSIYAGRVANRLDVGYGGLAFRRALDGERAALGDIQPLRDLTALRGFVGSRLLFTLFDLPFAPFFIAILYLIHPILFLMTLIGALVLGGLAVANQFATGKSGKTASEDGMIAQAAAQGFMRSSESIRAMGMGENAVLAWGARHAQSLKASDRVNRTNALFAGLSRAIRIGLQIAILGVGAWLVLDGKMTAGMIFASSIISGRALQPIDQLVGSWKPIIEARRAWKRFSGVLESGAMDRPGTALPDPEGRLGVENLTYYNIRSAGAEPLIKRIGFAVAPGEAIGVIGPSGAGKSTLLRLLVGALRPDSGSIRIDGTDLANWNRISLGTHIGYLAQEVELLPGTVAENIVRFAPEYDEKTLWSAAEKAHCFDLIKRLPQGFDTELGPGKMNLSGGERQRIGLARAFYGSPRFLFLDEPNASLDAEGDVALEKALAEARADGVTVLVVTQRSSIARYLDKMLVINNGQLEDFGPRDEVLARRVSATGQGENTDVPSVKGDASATPVPHEQKPANTSQGDTTGEPVRASFGNVMRIGVKGNT